MTHIMIQPQAFAATLINTLEMLTGDSAQTDIYTVCAVQCLVLGTDASLLPLAPTVTGKIQRKVADLVMSGHTPDALMARFVKSGAVLISPELQFNPQGGNLTSVGEVKCSTAPLLPTAETELHVPEYLSAPLLAAGIEEDAIAALYFHATSGVFYRQRIRSKAATLIDLISRGLITSPTGFFIEAVRKNWLLSRNYEPGKKSAPAPSPATLATRQLDAQRSQDESEYQRQLDVQQEAHEQSSPEQQWLAFKGNFRVLLAKVLTPAEWGRLEELALGGQLLAAREYLRAVKAKATLDWEVYLGELRAVLAPLSVAH